MERSGWRGPGVQGRRGPGVEGSIVAILFDFDQFNLLKQRTGGRVEGYRGGGVQVWRGTAVEETIFAIVFDFDHKQRTSGYGAREGG